MSASLVAYSHPPKVDYQFSRRKPTTAKHKKWDGDAYVTLTGEKLKLVSETGKMYVIIHQLLITTHVPHED